MHPAFFRVVVLCLGLVSPAVYASQLTLTLDDVLERGFDNSLDLQKNLIDLSSAEYSADRLWSELFPGISGSLGVSYGSPLLSGGGFELDRDRAGYSTSLGVNLSLNAGIPYAMRNIRLAYQTRLLNYEDARNQLGIQLTKSFFGLITDRDNLTVLGDLLNLAQLQYERAQVAFRNGLIRELDLMQSRLSLENVRYNLNYARSSYNSRLSDFLVQLGIPYNADVALEGAIAISRVEIESERLILENLPRRPDILSRRQEIERLENAEKQNAYANRAPSIRLEAQWSSANFNPFNDNLRGSATLNIPIDPWVPGSARGQSISNARHAVEKARLDLQEAENAAMLQVRSLAANLDNAWDTIEIARLGLAIAQRSFELAEQGFRSGTVESLRLEDAQNDLANARQRLLRSELAYLTMILDICAALNISWKDLMP